jgi:type IV pilus assembly protein PilM
MADDEKHTSIWKKEMSFRRKPADENASEGRGPESGSSSGSIWKKELSLRKKAQDTPEAPVEPEVVAAEPQPVIDLGPVAVVAPEPMPEPMPEPTSEPAAEHSWLTKPLEEISEPPDEPVAAVPPVQAVADAEPVLDEPTLVSFPVSLVPVEEPELDLDLDLALPIIAEAAPALVELPALPELPTAILPDLPTPPAPPAAAAEVEASVPFYKKEFSLKRPSRPGKPKTERTPKAEKPPKAAKAPKPEKGPKAARTKPAKAEAGEKVPFYKRELSFKRSPKEWDAAEPAAEPKPKASRTPMALPSLPSFSRGSSKKVVGLKIGGSQIAAACVNNGGSPELLQAVREPLEHGIVVGGELRDPEALAVALRTFFNANKLPKRNVRLGIANNRIGVRTFEVVGIDDAKQLANAIRFRAQEVLPIPLEEAVLDYQVLSTFVNDEGQKVSRVLLVVAYRELVDRYVYACKKAGLQIAGIDLEAFALLRAIAEPHDSVPGSERGALVAVSVGHDRSTFAVSDGRICEFTRVLEWGGCALNVAIARALDTSPSEAEPIKRALSFTGSTVVPDGFGEEQLATAREAARRQLQTFARELVSSLQFYQNQPGSLSIGEIVLTGGTAHLPGLGAELERLIGVPVRVADPLTRLKVSKKASEQEQLGSLAVAIGLGIDD